jgi:hypothetical protein
MIASDFLRQLRAIMQAAPTPSAQSGQADELFERLGSEGSALKDPVFAALDVAIQYAEGQELSGSS